MNSLNNQQNNNENSINNPKLEQELLPEIKKNSFLSRLTSRAGIIVISTIAIIIVVIIIICVSLHGKDKNDEINGEKLNEEEKDYKYKDKISSNTLYVKKINDLPEDFVLGMDLSSLITEENSGVKYYNFDGEEKDVLETLRYVGINYVRIRIWNDPFDSDGNGYGGGNNDMEVAIKIGKRAAKYNMKVLASYHFSDFYADPGRQYVPKAWRGLSLDEKSKKAGEYTFESLTRFKNEGVDIGMVALGNEVNDFFCGETQWPNIVKIMNECSKATRQVFPNALISVHFTNPERKGSMMYFAKQLYENKLDYDAFSLSYYNVWAGDLTTLDQLNDVAETYNKKIYIAETQYPYTRDNLDYYPNKTPGYDDYIFYPLTIQGQATHIRNLINHVANIKNSLGVFYWEGAWIAVGTKNYYDNLEKWEKYGSGWASSYSTSYGQEYFGGGCPTENQALFDSEGKPLESLKIFNLIKYGNIINPVEDGVEDISVNPIDFTDFSLPNTITVIDTSDQRTSRNVIWNNDFDKEKAAQTDLVYEYTGKADNIDIICIFENNQSNGRRCVCSYYIGEKVLSPWRLLNMIRIRET